MLKCSSNCRLHRFFDALNRGLHTSFRLSAVYACLSALSSVLLLFSLIAPAHAEKQSVRIGVLAYKGKAEAVKMWSSTAAYLQSSIPNTTFEIVPLDFNEIDSSVKNSEIDYLIANTSIYVEMESKYGVTRIATMRNKGYKGSYTQFGGAIFCRAGREDINSLADLGNKTFMAVDETSLGGWQAAWRELKAAGIDPYRNFSRLSFSQNHESVVLEVRAGKVDAGTARTDTLERMADEGSISLSEFRILNLQKHPEFSFLASTRLYPEWPVARLRTTPEGISKEIVVALLRLPETSPAALDAKLAGWTIPYDYQPVHELLKELRLPPYKDYGKVTLAQSLRQYWYLPLLSVIAMASMAAVLLHIIKLNRRVLAAKLEAENARSGLEQQIAERTADLRELNTELIKEIDTRKESEQRLIRAEQEQHEQLIFLQTVIDSVTEPVMVIAPDYRVKLVNRAAGALTEQDTFCYRISHNSDSPCDEEGCPCPLREVIKTGRPVIATHTHYRTDGSEMIVEIHASPVLDSSGAVTFVIEICRDITEKIQSEQTKKKDEQRMFMIQKEESISTLAGGIAHDFNNILMGILGNAELLKLRLPLKPEEVRPIDNIISSVDRMAELTRQILAYAKGGKYQPALLNLDDVIREAINLSHKGMARTVEVDEDFSADLWPVIADKNQMIQAFTNLLNNAFEVMEKTGGTLTVKAENSPHLQPWTCSLLHEHPGGDYVSVTISDTGPGIPDSISGRIFEPFFSTKFLGRGLGLPAALGIIQNHNGCITFESENSRGTTFSVYLPRAVEITAAEPKQETEPSHGPLQNIMIIDDENDIRQLLQAALKDFGYQVSGAESGEKAIGLLKNSKIRVDLAILDLQMPGMSGRDTFREIKRLSPNTAVLISTGYEQKVAVEEMSPYSPEGFIHKPYRISDLQELLQRLLPAKP